MKPKPCYSIWIFIFFLLIVNTTYSQSTSPDNQLIEELNNDVKIKYGSNQAMVNGILYESKYNRDLGHPFIDKEEFTLESIVIQDELYDQTKLMYNIYDQSVVILYDNAKGEQIRYVPSNKYISLFTLNNRVFKKMNIGGFQDIFFQEIYSGENVSCVYYWYKQREESYHQRTFVTFQYLDPKTKRYLIIQNELLKYNSKYKFVKLFPSRLRSDISAYIKTNKIKLKKSSDSQVNELVNYCDKLLNQQ
ncbi:MAG: hypothetical protein JXA77_14535 [Bacteroidales bacterium]|nr:hypothetical protein [Bacteroidales bacterium]MBN2818828.1 hypothetical protein [Bacteroidales bacterium]